MGVKESVHHGEEDNITLAVAEADKDKGAEPMEVDMPQAASEEPLGAYGRAQQGTGLTGRSDGAEGRHSDASAEQTELIEGDHRHPSLQPPWPL
ncbi:unnamed protein product [Vitrella brassicaformis CCMP3155]|uniref:Uncharacterized protein n=1 Tax=Vitrella brassicaformis (strain CCMP3155) TaxID=1169540 RepID=A0A0G4FQP2_VITBC|nr:unnamed protein product [Vitrella brassicaformis CCMP3155]|eukprot:CEM16391.1 unnamed protein product [Vitrella brassicaformis CCMP3155]